MLPRCIAIGWAVLGLAVCSRAADLPGNLAIDPTAAIKTQVPRVVPNSGRLQWKPHIRDLTEWPTLDYQDKRPTPKPRVTRLGGPLDGDAARGQAIAMDPGRGNCVACHQLPGDDWPGTLGNPLLHYRKFGYKDEQVYQQIFDARVFNPNSAMPAYGTFGILSDQDVRDLVAYLQNLD